MSNLLQPKIVDHRYPAGGIQNGVGLHARLLPVRTGEVQSVAFDAQHFGGEVKLDALPLQNLKHAGRDFSVRARRDLWQHFEHADPRPDLLKEAGKLQADVAPADNGDRLGDILQAKDRI